jgi:cyclic-di-AMP phosphodiesterase PgpH
MFPFRRIRPRRQQVRESRPDLAQVWRSIQAPQIAWAVAIAVGFWLLAVAITSLREQMVRVRPDQYLRDDVTARVEFSSIDPERINEVRQAARAAAPSVYHVNPNCFDQIQRVLTALPEDAAGRMPEQMPSEPAVDSATLAALKRIAADKNELEQYRRSVQNYVGLLKDSRDKAVLVVLPDAQRDKDMAVPERKSVSLMGPAPIAVDLLRTFPRVAGKKPLGAQREELLRIVDPLATRCFPPPLAATVSSYTVDTMPATHEYDKAATEQARNDAEKNAPLGSARRDFTEKSVLVERGSIVTPQQWKLLAEEQEAYVSRLAGQRPGTRLLGLAGMGGVILLITLAMSAYAAAFQPKIVRNKYRSMALAAVLLVTLLVAQLTAVSTQPLLIYATGPTIVAAMVLVIAYDQRFALGISTLHAVLVAVAVGQGVAFFLTVWVGVLAVTFTLDEVRRRSKLVEVGGAVALMMALTTAALGAMDMLPLEVIGRNALQSAAAGLGAGFIVVGILPLIEKAFRITTSMTLLELADASHPLLRRLQLEAPGTYSHSLQVATLAEAAAEAIGANSLLCRVGSYYHDIGKLHKPDYFCENQFGGPNRHINLTPSVSLLVIVGHVKDGMEMAKEYRLPPVIQHVIAQHHGTTLVEFFYDKARKSGQSHGEEVDESQFRYPGPKPRSRETAVVMVADIVESASRAMTDPAAHRVETLVHDLVMRRLLDGQFDECDLTFAELEQIEKAMVKTVLSLYHGRLPYPTNKPSGQPQPAAKSA